MDKLWIKAERVPSGHVGNGHNHPLSSAPELKNKRKRRNLTAVKLRNLTSYGEAEMQGLFGEALGE